MGDFGSFLADTKGFDDVKASTKLPFLTIGNYDVEVIRCVGAKARAGWSYFVAELEILASDNPNLPTGAKASFYVSFKDNIEVKKRNVLEFVMGFGLSEDDAKKALVGESITGPAQILAGEKTHIRAYEASSRKTGKKYLALQYSPVTTSYVR
jgi:hypothetical protein